MDANLETLRILVVDPDRDRREALRDLLLADGVGYVRLAGGVGAAKAVIPNARPDLVFCSELVEDGDPFQFAEDLLAGRVRGVTEAIRGGGFGLRAAGGDRFMGDLDELLATPRVGAAAPPVVITSPAPTALAASRARDARRLLIKVPAPPASSSARSRRRSSRPTAPERAEARTARSRPSAPASAPRPRAVRRRRCRGCRAC